MSIKKKIVWLPYDFDTAIGINNEGQLVFDYALEDTDHLEGGADIYNGQESVVWCNIRDAFGAELAEMYKTLRSTGALSYAKVEQMFEEHQSKWSEAIFNEDSWFKYIDPLIQDGSGAYLSMMQGSKAEQRKWWLYNRFRYIDSKYNAGDALSDLIQIRGYAKSDITVTPYADIYPTVKYGSYLVKERGHRGQATTLECPMTTLNDTEIYIYSASQLASVGDLSGFKVGFADFSMATKLQEVKLGDSDSEYDNPNLSALTFGNNVLLKKIDIRNCSGLGDTSMQGHTQQAVDVSGCSIVEEIYFDGTKITGLTLPNGGVIKKLHLPGTITNLTIRNQTAITEFVVPSYANISTLRLENVSSAINEKAILQAIPAASRVRLIGFYWTAEDADEIEDLLDILDTMRGLDEAGGNVDTAQVSGEIHTSALTGAQIAAFSARYPYINFTADHTSAVLSFYNGSTLITTQTVLDGGDGSYSGSTPTKTQDAQYTYTFAGWSKTDDNTVDADALTAITADRSVYACFTQTLRKYTVTFVRASADGGGTLQTINNVDYGTTITAASSYTGSTPTSTQGSATDYPFEGWNPASATVQGDTVFTAKFGVPVEVAEITDSWDTIIANIDNGTYKTAYKVGNYKPLDLGTEGTINMQIVAIDADELANGSGYAPLTFVGMELLNTNHRMNPSLTPASAPYDEGTGGVGGWKKCEMRAYLKNTIKPLIPSNVKSRINNVTKYSQSFDTSGAYGIAASTEDIWIPSLHEITGVGNESGVIYNGIFNSDNARKKMKVGGSSALIWWLRSSRSIKHFFHIDSSGSYDKSYAYDVNAIALGFCLGLEPETITDSWETILANENYATDYAIGDTKYLDLGTEGKHLMEIVGIDVDNRADGTGKAGLTWISKTLLNTEHRMNPANSSGAIGTGGNGGWLNCEMRTYLKETIKPLIPETVRNGIVEVTKVQSTVTDGTMVENGQTSTEDVWIPSNHEIFSTDTTYESTGVTYTKFAINADRVKKALSGTVYFWWLRSASSSTRFVLVNLTGDSGNSNAYLEFKVALGFCTN